MSRGVTAVTAFLMALTYAAAAKSTAPVDVTLPRNSRLKNTEQEKPENSKPAANLFFRKETEVMVFTKREKRR